MLLSQDGFGIMSQKQNPWIVPRHLMDTNERKPQNYSQLTKKFGAGHTLPMKHMRWARVQKLANLARIMPRHPNVDDGAFLRLAQKW